MGKIAALPVGQIIKGDFYGQYLYKWDNTTWGVCPGATLENSLLFGKLHWHSADYSQSGNWTGPTSVDRVSESTVDHYEEIGSQTTGPNASAMIKGTLIGGAALGMIAGAASTSATTDVAFFLKNGKSFVVRFSSSQAWMDLKSALFSLEKPQQMRIEPQGSSLPTIDKFEAIKKYKELLDMNIISKEEFDAKKDELINSEVMAPNNPVQEDRKVEALGLATGHMSADSKSNTTLNDTGEKTFLMPVEDVFKISGRGVAVIGVVKEGVVNVNDTVELVRAGEPIKTLCVSAIEMFHKKLSTAKQGENVGLVFQGVDKKEIMIGDEIIIF